MTPTADPTLVPGPAGDIPCLTLGTGPMTAVLLSGMGVPASAWFSAEGEEWLADLMSEPLFLAPGLKPHRTVAYDRPGTGERPSPPAPLTLDDYSDEIDAVLHAFPASQTVLIGHSIGGLFAYEFARRWPGRLAGLVLLDASHPHQRERLDRWHSPEHAQAQAALQVRIRDSHPERLNFAALFRPGFSVAGTLGELPLLAISRGKAPTAEEISRVAAVPIAEAEATRLADEWNALQTDLASASSRGGRVVAPLSGHYPHFDEPRLVIDKVRAFLASLQPHA